MKILKKITKIIIFGIFVLSPILIPLTIYVLGNWYPHYQHIPYYFEEEEILLSDNYNNLFYRAQLGLISFNVDRNENKFASFNIKGISYRSNSVDEDSSYYYFNILQNNYLEMNTSQYICKYDKEYNLVSLWDTSDLNWDIEDIKVIGSKLYCLSFTRAKDKRKIYNLFEVDIVEKKRKLLADNIKEDFVYINYSQSIYISVDLIGNYGRIIKQSDKTKLMATCVSTEICFDKINLCIANNQINLIYDNETFCINDKVKNPKFYKKAYIENNKLIFATYDFSPKNECAGGNRGGYHCVCGFGKSYFYIFDLELKKISLLKEYPEKTLIIDYDLNGPKYYYNKRLFINDVFFRECEEIKEGETQKLYGLMTTPREEYLISYFYFKGEFYFYKIKQ